MIFVILLVLGLAIGWLAVPVLRQMGYSYGRFGNSGGLLAVVVATVLVGFVIGSVILQSGDVATIIIGTVAALIVVALMALLGGGVAADEERQTKEFSDHR